VICRLRFAGFDPVGHVLGAAVVHLGYVSRAGKCSGSASYTPQTDLPDGGLLDRYRGRGDHGAGRRRLGAFQPQQERRYGDKPRDDEKAGSKFHDGYSIPSSGHPASAAS